MNKIYKVYLSNIRPLKLIYSTVVYMFGMFKYEFNTADRYT